MSVGSGRGGKPSRKWTKRQRPLFPQRSQSSSLILSRVGKEMAISSLAVRAAQTLIPCRRPDRPASGMRTTSMSESISDDHIVRPENKSSGAGGEVAEPLLIPFTPAEALSAAQELKRLVADQNPVIRQDTIRALAHLGTAGLPGLVQASVRSG